MDLASVVGFMAERSQGVLATHRKNGRPQLSNVVYGVTDGIVGVSITADRAKTHNLRRDPRASLHVTSDDFRRWAVVDCDVELGTIAGVLGDAGVSALTDLYRSIRGEHPDWDEFGQAMIDERRLVARLRPVHAYGQRV
ncbi:MAG: PPOX class F420-dependent oxidoreductase [Acidimicrobiia bacterium]|nr:PPOX class F420-dependent oxidoreductase [Acidimicrobiia bacterium]MDH4307488.1 PPOX class F420-dependent oxidoreductase [Acidimicrobiia bacterium]MDH5293873.1 PPOX class F420-dependent oxidoreductase [Acidimicrobiia bacterium]